MCNPVFFTTFTQLRNQHRNRVRTFFISPHTKPDNSAVGPIPTLTAQVAALGKHWSTFCPHRCACTFHVSTLPVGQGTGWLTAIKKQGTPLKDSIMKLKAILGNRHRNHHSLPSSLVSNYSIINTTGLIIPVSQGKSQSGNVQQ